MFYTKRDEEIDCIRGEIKQNFAYNTELGAEMEELRQKIKEARNLEIRHRLQSQLESTIDLLSQSNDSTEILLLQLKQLMNKKEN